MLKRPVQRGLRLEKSFTRRQEDSRRESRLQFRVAGENSRRHREVRSIEAESLQLPIGEASPGPLNVQPAAGCRKATHRGAGGQNRAKSCFPGKARETRCAHAEPLLDGEASARGPLVQTGARRSPNSTHRLGNCRSSARARRNAAATVRPGRPVSRTARLA
jgi:hypothetical protein